MKPTVKTLKNGTKLVLVASDAFSTVTAMVLAGTGSNYESDKEAGLSHFLEHMCFKGGKKYENAKVIAETLESLGALSNAFTTSEYTGYHVKGNPAHINVFLDVLSDMYLNAAFPEDEVRKEKGVIIEEINMYDDIFQHKVWEVLMDVMFPGQPAGRPIIGSKETVKSFTRDDLFAYKNKHYFGNNTVVAVCGPLTKANIKNIEKIFSAVPEGKDAKKHKTKISQKAFNFRIHNRKIDQAHLAIGFHSVPYRHKDNPAARLLATVLGRGSSSRLFHLLREELGVAYSVFADQEAFLDHGIFGINAGVDKKRVNEVIALIARELEDLKTNLVSDKELSKAREFSIGGLRMGLETTDDIAGYYGGQAVLRKELKGPKEVIKDYSEVTAQDIRRMARKLFVGKNGSLSIIGNYTEKDIDTSPLARL